MDDAQKGGIAVFLVFFVFYVCTQLHVSDGLCKFVVVMIPITRGIHIYS